MQEVLLRKLIEKDFFKVGTEVDAKHKAKGLAGIAQHVFEGTFTVTALLETTQTKSLRLDICNIKDGQKIRISPDQIIGIDGMTPERFAENYMINPEGGDIAVVGARRGRRPKGWNPITQRVEK